MSQTDRETNEDSDPESSNDASRVSSSGTTSECSTSIATTNSVCNSSLCKDSDVTSTSDQEINGHLCRTEASQMINKSGRNPYSTRVSTNTTQKRSNVLRNKRDEVMQRSQSTTGRKCDNITSTAATQTLKNSCPNSPRLEISSNDDNATLDSNLVNSDQCPSTSYLQSCSNRTADAQSPQYTLRPVPSAPAPTTDTNNNRNSESIARVDYSSGLRRSNFSKSASGSRLTNKNDARSNVCDCLSQNCDEKEHSNRRQFIENYYNSRTRLPSATAMSSLNISSPLNRLSECDAITKRLLSSPIRVVNFSEKPAQIAQISEIDKSRRASLGTNTMTEQVSLFSSSQFNSLELNRGKVPDNGADDNQKACDSLAEDINSPNENDLILKQQQGRSLSLCQEKSLKSRLRNTSSNHSSNLNRAVSLACDTGSSKRLLTIIPLFGCDMKALEQFMKLGLILPPAIDSTVDHILAHGINSIGIFRKSGVKSRILTLRQRIEAHQDATLKEINRDNEFSIYDIADLVKMWFRELKPVPIMTKELIRMVSEFAQSSGSLNEQQGNSSQSLSQREKSLDNSEVQGHQKEQHSSCSLKSKIDSTISPAHKALFSKAMNFFALISSKSEINQMTSQNLAICLTPSLCATETDQNSIMVAQKALQYCIDNYRILF